MSSDALVKKCVHGDFTLYGMTCEICEQIAMLTRERDEAIAKRDRYGDERDQQHEWREDAERERDEARADAAQKGEALRLTEEALTIHVMADAACEMGADAGDELAVSMARAALADTSAERLAERDARIRDDALEEAAIHVASQGWYRDEGGEKAAAICRALKRGGK